MKKKRRFAILLFVILFFSILLGVLAEETLSENELDEPVLDYILESGLDVEIVNYSLEEAENGYIIELEEPSIIEKEQQLKELAEKNEKRIKDMRNINPLKYSYMLFSTRRDDIPGLIIAHKGKIEADKDQAKTTIKEELGKKKITHITGNAIENPEDLNVIAEYKNVLNGFVINITEEEAENLKNLRGIKSITPNKEVEASTMDSIPLIKAHSTWNLGYTGKGITIAIIDTGIDYNHPDLGGCFGSSCKVIGGYDFVNNDANPIDDHGHGTHCAGIAAGDGVLKGVAPDAKLYAYKVLSSSGIGTFAQVISGIERATDPNKDGNFSDRADVISMSLGGGSSCSSTDAFMVAIDNAIRVGIAVVVAAGNNGPGSKTISAPGCHEPVITVGATDKSDKLASFSSRGPAIEDGIEIEKPDVVAPGVSICAAQWDSAWQSYQCYDTKHTAISGTSMATPHVAGLAALLKQADHNLTNADIKNILQNTAVDLGLSIYEQGYGRINALNALSSYNNSIYIRLDTSGILAGNVDIYGKISVKNFSSYRIEFSPLESDSWNLITESNELPQTNLLYSQWDTSLLSDGKYSLKLTVYTSNGTSLRDTNTITLNNFELSYPENNSWHDTTNTIEIKGTVTGDNLNYYEIKWGKDSQFSSEGITLANNGQTGVTNGILGIWEINTTKSGFYNLKLIVHQIGGAVSEDVVTLYLDAEQLKGWPVQIGGKISSSPIVADLDREGNKELIISSGNKEVYVINPDGTIKSGWPKTTVYGPGFTPSVGDVNGDGDYEIVVANYYYIYIWNHDGTSLPGWPKYTYPRQTYRSASLEDLDNDGDLEIIIGDFGGYVNVWHHNGTYMKGWPLNLTPYIINNRPEYQRIADEISVADLDNDGFKELVVWTYKTGQYFVLETEGTIKKGWPQLGDPYGSVSSSIGDVDNDGNLEIVGSGKSVKIWDVNGNLKYNLGNSISTERASLGELDGDGELEIIGGGANYLNLYDIHNHVYEWRKSLDGNVLVIGGPSNSFITIADVNGDDSPDIITSSQRAKFGENAFLHAFNKSGEQLEGWPKLIDYSPDGIDMIYSTATVDDIDNNGDVEVFVGGKDGRVYAWALSSPYNPKNTQWKNYRRDGKLTSLYSSTPTDAPALFLVRNEFRGITPYSFTLDLETSNPTNITVNIIKKVAVVGNTTHNTQTYNHTILVDGLESSTKYNYTILIKDAYRQTLTVKGENEFFTRTTSKVPALPTSFYGRVETTDGKLVPYVEVTASWTDVDNNNYTTLSKTMNLQEATAFGDHNLEGYYFFNQGKVKAKKGSKIEVSASQDLNDPQPFILADPGNRAKEIEEPILLSGIPAEITILSPNLTSYSSSQLPIFLNYNSSKILKTASYKLNNAPLVNILNKEGQNIQLSPKIGNNILNISVIDIANIPTSKAVEFTVDDITPPNLSLLEPEYSKDTIKISAYASDNLSPLGSCEVCIGKENCTSWIPATKEFSEGSFNGKCSHLISKSSYADGVYKFNLRIKDSSDNLAIGSASTLTLDKISPAQITNPKATTLSGEASIYIYILEPF